MSENYKYVKSWRAKNPARYRESQKLLMRKRRAGLAGLAKPEAVPRPAAEPAQPSPEPSPGPAMPAEPAEPSLENQAQSFEA